MSVQKFVLCFVCIFFITNITMSVIADENGKGSMQNNVLGKKWTFMFYDDADFHSSGDPLKLFVKEAFSGENLNVIVLQDEEYNPAKIWYIDENHNKELLKDLGEINMGDYKTLKDFIEYCKTNFTADRYIISFYNHGMGWEGACRDDTSNDSLTMDEMQKAFTETGGVDIVCFTAPCLMANIEAVYELRNCTDVYVGSEETSGYRWWSNVIGPLCEMLNQNSDIGNIELGKRIIELIREQSYSWPEKRDNFTMSAMKTDKMDELGEAIDSLSLGVLSNFNRSYELICSIYEGVQSFGLNGFLDVYDFAEKCFDVEVNQTIRHDLEHVLENLTDVVIAEAHGNNKPGAHGLSIYLPNPSHPIYETKYGESEYGLDFAGDTHWDELLNRIWLKKIRGIAIGSATVGNEIEVSDILRFIDDCNINMLIVDFGWITWSWNITNFNAVNVLINATQQRSIPTWVMYRARTLPGQYKDIQHQVHKNGEVDEREICFTSPEGRNWSIRWAHKLLEKYPAIDGLILYNPHFLPDCCYCSRCLEKFAKDTGIDGNPAQFDTQSPQYEAWSNWRTRELADFIKEWKNSVATLYPHLKVGLVLDSGDTAYLTGQNLTELGEIVDMICPFVALDSVTDNDFAGGICNHVKEATNATVVADIKIYGPYDNNDNDIVNAIDSSLKSNGDGFFLWDFDSLDPGRYNIDLVKKAYNPYYYGSPRYTSNSQSSLSNYEPIFIVVVKMVLTVVSILFLILLKQKRFV